MSETKIIWTDCKIKLSDLKPWSDNPRVSTKAQAKRILASFEKFGQVQPVAIGPGDEVYDGHQRLSALFTIHGGDYTIDARRASRALSDNERRELVLALHNATGGWNWDTLSGWNADGLKDWGFDGETLKQWNNDALNLREFLGVEEQHIPVMESIGGLDGGNYGDSRSKNIVPVNILGVGGMVSREIMEQVKQKLLANGAVEGDDNGTILSDIFNLYLET